jgi:methylmalonyl-CoA mutase, C-terminal domain
MEAEDHGIGETIRGRPLGEPEPPQADQAIRVVLGKMRFDAHDVGARYVMRKLVEAGMEVIFVRFELVQELIDAAVEEDADVIGLSSLTGGHLSVAADLVEGAISAGLDDRLILVGGVIADGDAQQLRELDIDGVFGPGTSIEHIVAFIRDGVARQQAV